MEKIITRSIKETQRVAAKFAKQILRREPGKTAVVLALQGDLGAGKTTFVQGFAKGLGIKEKILSPTFVLIKRFKIGRRLTSSKFKNFYHIDCYRLEDEKDLTHLGFKEIVSDPQNIVAIEWPEKISKVLPKGILKIKFDHLKNNQRKLTIAQ